MPTKIRLQRKGKKGLPVYHVVIADGRAPRDGKFIERIGIYNPVTKPAEIDIDFERALYWLQAGAEPTDTVNALLSFKGVLYKHHLLKGVKKGAMTEEMAEAKFQAWLQEKKEKFVARIKEAELSGKDSRKKKLEAEMKVNEARARELQAKRAKELKARIADETEGEVAEPEVEAIAAEEPVAEVQTVVEEIAVEAQPAVEESAEAAEQPVVEEAPVVEEEPVAEAVAEAEAEPVADEPVAEVQPETEEETEPKA
ncbi:MAG: 30S ribosomal protein S16 [Bacteroidales bacterium]|jgi:small subunit ribosomal protein S16|nr:30S ribosomal protein S16 [Bacteroidales bacterium]